MSPIIDPVTEYSDWIDASSSKGVVMARYATTVETSKTPKKVFAYMADLRNFAEWDPGVKAVTQVKGSGGGPGTVFDVTVAGVGRDLTLRYVTEEYEAPRNLLVVAHSAVFTSIDRITVEPDGKGSVITYDAALRLNGVLHVGDLGLQLMFGVIGDRVPRTHIPTPSMGDLLIALPLAAFSSSGQRLPDADLPDTASRCTHGSPHLHQQPDGRQQSGCLPPAVDPRD